MSNPISEDKKEKLINVLDIVISDCKSDADGLDGREFNGRNVAEQFGNNLAMIQAVAKSLRSYIEEQL